jgi:hypothetical protein
LQLAARNFDHTNDARGDLGDANAARIASGEVDLDGLGTHQSTCARADTLYGASCTPKAWVNLNLFKLGLMVLV